MVKVVIKKDGQRILPENYGGDGRGGLIPELNKLEPFGSLLWGCDTVYTTPSMANEAGRPPGAYIYDRKVIDYNRGLTSPCLGGLFNAMTEDEQSEFIDNIEEIMLILNQ